MTKKQKRKILINNLLLIGLDIASGQDAGMINMELDWIEEGKKNGLCIINKRYPDLPNAYVTIIHDY